MVRHIVMFWLKEKTPELITETIKLLKSMEGRIPGLVTIEAGPDVVGDERSCDICLNCLFSDMSALKNYRTHPVHLPVQAHMHRVRERSASADYFI